MSRRRGQVIPRGKDTWQIRVHAGNRKYPSRTVYGTKKDAEVALTAWQQELDSSGYTSTQRYLLRDYLEKWLNEAVRIRVRERTYEGYESDARRVSAGLGDQWLHKLTRSRIR